MTHNLWASSFPMLMCLVLNEERGWLYKAPSSHLVCSWVFSFVNTLACVFSVSYTLCVCLSLSLSLTHTYTHAQSYHLFRCTESTTILYSSLSESESDSKANNASESPSRSANVCSIDSASQTNQTTTLLGNFLLLEPKYFFRDPPKHSGKKPILSDVLVHMLESFPSLLPFG